MRFSQNSILRLFLGTMFEGRFRQQSSFAQNSKGNLSHLRFGYLQLLPIGVLGHISTKPFVQFRQKHHLQIMCHSMQGAIAQQYLDE